MTTHLFGIRHHGPGSARSLKQTLEKLQPDAILIEGPKEAESLLHLISSPAMQPPVALLIYTPDNPQNCFYYPFAIFSPEWQAMLYGITNSIPIRFMDLPLTHRLAMEDEEDNEESKIRLGKFGGIQTDTANFPQNPKSKIIEDPLELIALAAGYSDREMWWERMVEQRSDSEDLFAAILEVMTAVRQELPPIEDAITAKREAYMRATIREADKQGFKNIAVICGAFHTPALLDLKTEKEDAKILKGLPKVKVEATWVPWTYGRLSNKSGYGAGIESPGWYHHLWEVSPPHSLITVGWMTQVAQLLREQDLDTSPAQVIEAVRLAETLAALREHPLPGLPELNEAIQTCLCFGSDLPMHLINEKLTVSERLGKVPPETPMVPLQQDLTKLQKKLRLPPQATEETKDLDLRKDTDLARSHLLHRLTILDVNWGTLQPTNNNKKGTFHEYWRLQWHPELSVNLIEAGIWGNTIYDAANNKACHIVDKAEDLPTLTNLLNYVILADLPNAVVYLMLRLENFAALTSDVTYLMAALPPLVKIIRYGNVRHTDGAMVSHIVDGMVTRIFIGLPGACLSLDDDAAVVMYDNIMQVNSAISLLKNSDHTVSWQQVLTQMSDSSTFHGLISGRCCRLLLDANVFDINESARRMSLALSTASEPSQAAAWLEGFLKGSGLLLLHDDNLWQVLDNWFIELPEESFTALLPLLRRTFSTFSTAQRRQISEKAQQAVSGEKNISKNIEFDAQSAAVVLPTIAQLLGI